ncbi:hypothetical protein NDU88_004805 [Pleurodeles waltl]|uniref:Uncharacterized protein n=1 Tax=Pleurodeles waltl TaxID=8319 RepID=A0AAV7M7D0_PLEWA|nr:hypothetical protein NDU88_004805 [Pleurodeles waltl]
MTEHLDKHVGCLDATECWISEAEDGHATVMKAQTKMDKLLLALQAKVEAWEARSRRNNIHKVESTDIDNMEWDIERLLVMLLGRETSETVEQAHHTLARDHPWCESSPSDSETLKL